MTVVLALLASYLIGSLPSAYLAGRVRGIDLGKVGSGNYGATNAYRMLGAGPASIVMLLDVGKGFVPVKLFPELLRTDAIGATTYGVLLAVAAILGHVFSIFLRFRGGKGIGTAAGGFLALAPGPTALAAVTWIVIIAWKRIVSLASLAAAIALLSAVWIVYAAEWPETGPLILITTLLTIFVFWTHRENIGRLRRGEEKRIRSREGMEKGA